MRALGLRLEGTYQAWGLPSFNGPYHLTEIEPTDSGVRGLLMACFGIEKAEQKEWLRDFASCSLWLDVKNSRYGKREYDYQTLAVGSSDGDNIRKRGLYQTAGGKRVQNTEEIIKAYLVDGCYFVWITGEDDKLDAIKHFLCHPIFSPYLGRKNCIPSCSILYEDTDNFSPIGFRPLK